MMSSAPKQRQTFFLLHSPLPVALPVGFASATATASAFALLLFLLLCVRFVLLWGSGAAPTKRLFNFRFAVEPFGGGPQATCAF